MALKGGRDDHFPTASNQSILNVFTPTKVDVAVAAPKVPGTASPGYGETHCNLRSRRYRALPSKTFATRVIIRESFLFEKIQGIFMPKLKTHKGASKRFKKTGTGKVVRNHAFGRHILTSKPHKRKKKLHQSVVADKADQPVLKRMLPY